ncbi:MAG: AbgT family transporter, partial [Lachnospiraceae bacterium]|nr:AbgT family transporter [Lachnospiraceae bacterium]
MPHNSVPRPSYALTKSFENTGYIFTLMFFASIMLGLLEWSNIGVVLATNIVDLVGSLNFSGIPLLFVVFVSIIIISILIPSTLIKWNIIAPIFVPMLIRANITPSFAQAIFQAADAVGKLFSPIYIYLIITIGFLYKSDQNINTSIFSVMRKILPIILILALT